MRTLSVGKRIAIAVGCMIAVVVFGGNMGFWGLKYCIYQGNKIRSQITAQGRILADSIEAARSAQVDFKGQVQQWKDILLRGQNPAAYQEHLEKFNQQGNLTQEHLKELRDIFVQNHSDVTLVDRTIMEHKALVEEYLKALKTFDPKRQDAGMAVDRMVKGIDRKAAESFDALVTQAMKVESSNLSETEKAFNLLMTRVLWVFSIGSVFGIGIGVACAFAVSRALTRQLEAISNRLDQHSHQVTSAAGQVTGSSHSLASSSSTQAASSEESRSSLEEITSMNKRNAEHAAKASQLVRQARETAEQGASQMEKLNSAMAAIRESSEEISKIIRTIDDVALQTNLLALNAAVEAARAGEAGSGFSVVADEVRSLAQRSAKAAKETEERIQDAMSKALQGVEISEQMSRTLVKIGADVRQVDGLVEEVSVSSKRQCDGILDVNRAIGKVDEMTQTNAASAEECASAAEQLRSEASIMQESVSELLSLVGMNVGLQGRRRTEAQPTQVSTRKAAGRPAQSSARTVLEMR